MSNVPDTIKAYTSLGVNLNYREGSKQAQIDDECPICNRDGKFFVDVEDGKYHCFKCRAKGNINQFINWLLTESLSRKTDYKELRDNRGLLKTATLKRWGVCKSIITGKWLVPGCGPSKKYEQKYQQVYRYENGVLYPTQTLGHCMHGLNIGKNKKENIYVCEGPWDAMALEELFRLDKVKDVAVIAVPGCNTFKESWTKVFASRHVVLLYDNDHERVHKETGKKIEPAGYNGTKRVCEILLNADRKPKSVKFLKWGENGFDKSLPTGTDIRDMVREFTSLEDRVGAIDKVLSRVSEIPREWMTAKMQADSTPSLETLDCTQYRNLRNSWKKALKWTHGLDHALTCMLASITSVKSLGDQLWMKIIGPASCGKSTLCEAVSVNKKYVYAKSTIRGFHSGYSMSGDSQEDNSLLANLYDKTLVTKDGDTLLQAPNLSQILSEARDIYDGTSRTHYRNKMSKDYDNVRMTWLLCGTSSLHTIDSSELGERFLDCRIMDEIDLEVEEEILWRVAYRTVRNMSVESNGKATTQNDADLTRAMQLTGGYIDYLRENAQTLLDQLKTPKSSLRRCIDLGRFVSFMRARPSQRQDETAEREFGARLVSQLLRLGSCLAIVLNEDSLNDTVMDRVQRVALDTARGHTLQMCGYLYNAKRGLTSSTLSTYLEIGGVQKVSHLLKFLKKIGVVEVFTLKNKRKWRLTEVVDDLYEKVMDRE